MKKINIIRFSYVAVFLILCACTQNTKDSGGESLDTDYPGSAKQLTFELDGGVLDSAKVVAEIDIWDNGTPVGQINGMEKFGDTLFFSDKQQQCVHMVDADDFSYIGAIGTGASGPEPIYSLIGIRFYDDILFIGDGSGPNLFKAYDPLTGKLESYANNDPPAWFFDAKVSGFFLTDSIAYITKMIADQGNKVDRYKISNGQADKLDEIVPVNDLHTEVDSATASRIIASMSLLKSNTMDRIFYVLPSNKYLINQYSFEGELIRSIDLRSIPEVAHAVDFYQSVPATSFYQSAVIDEADNIYFHIPVVEVQKEVYEAEDVGMYLISLNLADSSYRLYPMASRSVKPLRIIDNTLWCYDFTESRLLKYEF